MVLCFVIILQKTSAREVQHGEKDLRCQQEEFLLQGEFQMQEGQTDSAVGIPLGAPRHPWLRLYTVKIPM